MARHVAEGGIESQQVWQRALHACRASGIDALPLGMPLTGAAWELLAEAAPPPAVRAFADLWTQQLLAPWDVLARSAATVNPRILDAEPASGAVGRLRSLMEQIEFVALTYGQTAQWSSPDQWAYLVQIGRAWGQGQPGHLLLHPPATDADVAKAEHALNLTLPPSYKDLLAYTNGIGLGPTEDRYIGGAGPSRARWKPVVLNFWLECAGQHEIAALWREFQGMYAYERIQDRERGENTFLSDETALVPFAFTNGIWCFDWTQPDADGEYPVVFWDSEVRQARTIYPDFAAWFADQMGLFLPLSA